VTARAAAVVAVVLAASGLAIPQSASGAQLWSPLVLSRHGNDWSDDLNRPLFDQDLAWVPGDERTSRFYARNQSGDAATLEVTVRVDQDRGLVDRDAFRMAVQGAGGWQRVDFDSSQPSIRMALAKGAVQPIDVRIRLLPSARGAAMDRSLSFTVQVRLTQKDGARG
jgi:hypothetical protein